ncbi:MAG: LPXTG cell wall anchor domain-containing protein [Syntrophomonadaceae bacterium]|nr:LPXTG cell wall anchor domain-containing protein [Syntrophomonadaceae bacterium]
MMRRLVARIIFWVLCIYVVTSGFNHAKYAYSLPSDNGRVEWGSTQMIWDNDPDKSDIAETIWKWENPDEPAQLTIENAYPGYESYIITNIRNTTSMPITLKSVNILGKEDLEKYLEISFEATDKISLVDRIINANESLEVELGIRVTENVEQGQGNEEDSPYSFDIVIIAEQATEENEEPGGPGGGGGSSGGGTGDSGIPGDNTVEENIIEELNVEPEQPHTMLSEEEMMQEEEIAPESPQISIAPEPTSLPIKYNELPYTGGSPYALIGAILTMAGIGFLLRKKLI